MLEAEDEDEQADAEEYQKLLEQQAEEEEKLKRLVEMGTQKHEMIQKTKRDRAKAEKDAAAFKKQKSQEEQALMNSMRST